MEFATFALMMAGLIVGFLPGVAVGWHARPKVVEVYVTEDEPRVQAGDNEIVTYVRPGRREVTR
jgi:hypothetical protein